MTGVVSFIKMHINFSGERFGALNTFLSVSIPEIKKFERSCGRVLGMIQIYVLKKLLSCIGMFFLCVCLESAEDWRWCQVPGNCS